ncbi:MAG: hypothetical protein GF355_00380 [Candidatus Eisenbacteria bacterium]|nr:hypothetical protein [Candidatus Eisenbacteria bacterium]
MAGPATAAAVESAAPASPADSAGSQTPAGRWSLQWSEPFPEPLRRAADLSLDPLGRLLVVDGQTGEVWSLDPRQARRPTPFGASDQGSPRFENPTRVFSRWGLHVYTLDPLQRLVSVFDLQGRYRTTLDLAAALTASGLGGVEFTDLAVDKTGDLRVLDRLGGRLLFFDREGNFRDILGDELTDGERMISPEALDIDPEGHLFVADPAGRRVLKWSRQGSLLQVWRWDDGPAGVHPGALAVSGGRLYIADPGRRRIIVVDPAEGTQDEFYAPWSLPGARADSAASAPPQEASRLPWTGPGSRLTALAAGPEGDVLLLDQGRRRIYAVRYHPLRPRR